MPVPGNHDLQTGSGKWFYNGFKENHWIGEGKAGYQTGYYAAKFPQGQAGAWHLFAINSEIDAQPNDPQFRWLKTSLKSLTERCVLSFWHAPLFSSGRHGHDESKDFGNAVPVKQPKMSPVFELLYAAHASLILNGHDHNFEHLAPHNSSGAADDTGLRTFVIGTGGRRLYQEYAKKLAVSRHFDARNYGFLKIDLYADSYDWQFMKAGEEPATHYSGSGSCNSR